MNAKDFFSLEYDGFLLIKDEALRSRVYRFAEAYYTFMKMQDVGPNLQTALILHQTHLQFVDQVNKILDGEVANWSIDHALRQRLYDLRTLLGIAERVISTLPRTSFNRGQWHKVRADYAKRREQQ